MKKNSLITSFLSIIFLFSSCKDAEPSVDPIIGLWELDDVSVVADGTDFSYVNESGSNNLVGEDSFTIELKTDLTFERKITNVEFSDGSTSDIEEQGEWELDSGDLDLFLSGTEISGLPYSFIVTENSSTELVVNYSETATLFPFSKLQEWFNAGLINESGVFTGTDAEFDSLVTNFTQAVTLNYTLEFDKL